MNPILILLLITFINSNNYKIIDLESYKYVYYAKDINQNNDDIIIYKYEPKTEKRNIYLLFLGNPNNGSFEFYLYKEPSEIKYDDNNHLSNYLEQFDNYGEIKINQALDAYYILVKMNSYEEQYDYINFMIYNTEEYWNIGEFELNKEYPFALIDDKDIILTYPAKDITQQLYIHAKGDCDEIYYSLYKNNSEEESIDKIYDNCNENQFHMISFIRNNNYYLKLSFQNNQKYKIFRLVLYFLTNKKNIKEINDFKTDINYAYTSFLAKKVYSVDQRYYFINVTNLPENQLLGYNIIEPFNAIKYKASYKIYAKFDIDTLPNGHEVTNFDYNQYTYYTTDNEPFFTINKGKYNGLFLRIDSSLLTDSDKFNHNEMVVYLYPKIIYYLSEEEKFNHTDLSKNNVFSLRYKKRDFIMKSNLDYFTQLYPQRRKIKSKTFIFDLNSWVFEIQNSENASVEFQYIKDSVINMKSPYIMPLCKDNIKEEKLLYLPYMTDFNILFGDIKVYDMNLTSLNSIDDLYDDNYVPDYSSIKRYDNYLSLKDEQFFYKLKCNKYSLIKVENFIKANIEENITVAQDDNKLILDFSKYDKKIITFESKLSLYIGILNSQEMNDIWSLIFYINEEKYTLNNTNDTFLYEFKANDILKIEKPDTNIHPYLKVKSNYKIEKFRPLRTYYSGIFVFDKNITEEYNILINISYNVRYYSYLKGRYSLFYGDPNNFDYNELFYGPIEMNNNPYQYLENTDENKYFFILFQKGSYDEEFRIIKYSKTDIKLNELTLIENDEAVNLKIYLPKVNKAVYCFIQYFYEPIKAYSGNNILEELSTNRYYNLNKYELYKDMEVYFNSSKFSPYKSFFYVSYHDMNEIDDFESRFRSACSLRISNISDYLNEITIEIFNYCSVKQFQYFVFITSNTSNTTNYFNDKTPIELFYEKDKNKNLKYYDFNTEEDIFEIHDTFEKGLMNISIVGMDNEGYKAIVIAKKEYNYVGNKKSYTTYIVIGCIGGAIIIAIIICIVVKQIKKRRENDIEQRQKILVNQAEEKAKKDQIGSADFAAIEEDDNSNIKL